MKDRVPMRSSFVRQFSVVLAVSSGLGLTIATKPAAADTITGYIFNNTVYQQTSNSAPTTPQGYFFDMGLFFDTAGDYTAGSVTYPGSGSPQSLPAPAGSTQFDFNSSLYPSLAALHADYPFGRYTITASGGSAGTETSRINYKHDYFAKTVPYVTNFMSLNGLNPAANFSVHFNSFTPNSHVEGFTFLTIYDASNDVVFSDPFLDPTSTTALILAGTLLPDTTYSYELDFSDRLNKFDKKNSTFTTQGFDLRTDGSFTTGDATTPLPSTWTMLIAGFIGLGFFAKRGAKNNLTAIATA